jgi:HEAT repeat protein
MTQESIDQLIASARAEPRDSPARLPLVAALQGRGDRDTFEAAMELVRSPRVHDRILGVDILGQLGAREGVSVEMRPFRKDTVLLLTQLAVDETDPEVLHTLGVALGHLKDRLAVAPLARLRDHPDAGVRYAVAFGLAGVADDDEAQTTLLELSSDPDESVRDFATFALATLTQADTPEIRDALKARLDDEAPVVRAEALRGLALRGDMAALEPALEAIATEQESDDPGVLYEAVLAIATATADPRFCPYLRREQASWEAVVSDELPSALAEALRRCCAERA